MAFSASSVSSGASASVSPTDGASAGLFLRGKWRRDETGREKTQDRGEITHFQIIHLATLS
jgi:hypothetical protein